MRVMWRRCPMLRFPFRLSFCLRRYARIRCSMRLSAVRSNFSIAFAVGSPAQRAVPSR
jgi:hypothetical protein